MCLFQTMSQDGSTSMRCSLESIDIRNESTPYVPSDEILTLPSCRFESRSSCSHVSITSRTTAPPLVGLAHKVTKASGLSLAAAKTILNTLTPE